MQEILINAVRVGKNMGNELYEFVVDESLSIVECIHLDSISDGFIAPIEDPKHTLNEILFELNHVRVNPRVDNALIIQTLTDALKKIGVNVSNPPEHNSMAVCFKPLGEITDNVRFFFREDGKFIFLSPALKPAVIHGNRDKAAPSLSAGH